MALRLFLAANFFAFSICCLAGTNASVLPSKHPKETKTKPPQKTLAPVEAPVEQVQGELYPDLADTYFRTHITSGTSTPRPWGISYKRFPGALFSEHLLLNSITVGVKANLELGTVPLMYLGGSFFNINGKFSTSQPARVNNSRIYFGLGVSTFFFQFKHDPVTEKNGSVTEKSTLGYYFLSGVMTWVTALEWLSFCSELSYSVLSSSSDAINEQLKETQTPFDFMFDLSLRYSPKLFHTLGVGWTRSHSFDVFSKDRIFGFGNSFTWVPKFQLLDSLSVGVHYFPENKKPYLMLGAAF